MILALHPQINCTMNKLKLLKYSVITLLVLNVALMAFLFFGRPHSHPPHRGEKHLQPKVIIIEKLHLSKEQVFQYEELIKEHRSEIEELDQQLGRIKNYIYSSVSTQDSLPEEKLMHLSTVQQQIERAHYRHFQGIKALFTTEQLEYFQELSQDLSRMFAPNHPKRK